MKKYDKERKTIFDVHLVDDGTLDTVLSVYNPLDNVTHEVRFDSDYIARIKDGSIPAVEFARLADEAIESYFEALA